MERSEVFEVVQQQCVERLKVRSDEVTERSRFADDLGADSLDLTELVMDLEDRFAIVVPEEEMDDVRDVGQAVDVVMARLIPGGSP